MLESSSDTDRRVEKVRASVSKALATARSLMTHIPLIGSKVQESGWYLSFYEHLSDDQSFAEEIKIYLFIDISFRDVSGLDRIGHRRIEEIIHREV
jgi:hypothetical protein